MNATEPTALSKLSTAAGVPIAKARAPTAASVSSSGARLSPLSKGSFIFLSCHLRSPVFPSHTTSLFSLTPSPPLLLSPSLSRRPLPQVNSDLTIYKGLLSKLAAAKELQAEFLARERKRAEERAKEKAAAAEAAAKKEAAAAPSGAAPTSA